MFGLSRQTLFNGFKVTVYSLLAVNVYLFFRHATANEALDSFGWLILLVVFELETRALDKPYVGRWEQAGIWALQITGYGIAVYATWNYFQIGEWADFVNSVIWLIVCATIIYDVFVPGEFGSREWKIRNGIKTFLYILLSAVAVYWGVTGDWLDFYDALLWILCFMVIELNIFKYESEEDESPTA